ncbi:MAG: hypothetical protein F4Z62_04405 [Rhodothermaceae bacterium]|nr:hypothetical protein [Rhodothermaceae bacterium]MYE61972.1 hypothetical protein [Rhodothermaceae bacterium]
MGVGRPIVVTKCTKDFVQSSEKENKKADYDQARSCWLDYLGYRCVDQIDASDGTVADFLIGPHEAGLVPNTILLTLALVRSDRRKQGLDLTG